jgi:hypothetical protein
MAAVQADSDIKSIFLRTHSIQMVSMLDEQVNWGPHC